LHHAKVFLKNYEDVGFLKQLRPRDLRTSAVEPTVNEDSEVDSNISGESSDVSESEGL
jgi:hypothetical protein